MTDAKEIAKLRAELERLEQVRKQHPHSVAAMDGLKEALIGALSQILSALRLAEVVPEVEKAARLVVISTTKIDRHGIPDTDMEPIMLGKLRSLAAALAKLQSAKEPPDGK